jgi:hypothetical protein
MRRGAAAHVSGSDRAPWFIVAAFDAQGVEVVTELKKGTGSAYRLRNALLAETGIDSVTVERCPESYGGHGMRVFTAVRAPSERLPVKPWAVVCTSAPLDGETGLRGVCAFWSEWRARIVADFLERLLYEDLAHWLRGPR